MKTTKTNSNSAILISVIFMCLSVALCIHACMNNCESPLAEMILATGALIVAAILMEVVDAQNRKLNKQA